jgi:hypothetical protein
MTRDEIPRALLRALDDALAGPLDRLATDLRAALERLGLFARLSGYHALMSAAARRL